MPCWATRPAAPSASPAGAPADGQPTGLSFRPAPPEADGGGGCDGSALLWRLRLDGDARASAWRPLADLAERVSRPGFVFGEVHAALAYAACGDTRALERLIDGLRGLHAKGHPVAGTVALPLVQGTVAFVAGDHAGALAHFEPVEGEIHRVGGSHAQWELFEETMVDCYLGLERYDDAIRVVRRRLERRASPRDQRWLDRANRAS